MLSHHKTLMLRRFFSFTMRNFNDSQNSKTTTATTMGYAIRRDTQNDELEDLWKNPEKYALPQKTTYTDFQEATVNWSFVERLMPLKVIPEMPKNCGILPSGWRPPQDPAPKLPYYIRRNTKHMPEICLETRRDELNPKTMDFEYVELVTLRGIYGNIFECESDIREFLEGEIGHPIATQVDEIKGLIKIKGVPRSLVEKFVFNSGF